MTSTTVTERVVVSADTDRWNIWDLVKLPKQVKTGRAIRAAHSNVYLVTYTLTIEQPKKISRRASRVR